MQVFLPTLSRGRPHKLFQRGNVYILLIFVRLLMMQCKCKFTKRFTASTQLHHRENAPCYDNSHKNVFRWQP